MNAGKIEVTFEGLCAFFTKHLPEHRLMVGLVGVWGADDVIHVPTLSIAEEGISETTVYSGKSYRKSLTGNVYFHLLSQDSLVASDITKDASVKLLDVDGIYSPESLAIDPQRCQARLHFGNGILSQMRSNRVTFTDLVGNPITDPDGNLIYPDEQFTYNVKLEVAIPEGSYPVLHFDGEADDFVFKADRNYIITVTSLPESGNRQHMSMNHFQYFYRLAGHSPATIVVPNPADGHEEGRPWCMLSGFGNTEY